jgi:hypothetical protein
MADTAIPEEPVKENVVALNNENDELWSNMCLTV